MEIDFETYSEAGFIWCEQTQKYKAPPNATKKGLPSIGAAAYAEHPSTEVLSCAYDLGNGVKKLWCPGMLPPFDLFEYVKNGGIVEAWNVKFERWIWLHVCVKKYGWPEVQDWQWRDTAAKAVAHALPKSLDACGNVLNITNKKDKDGIRLLNKFSMPRNPTKSNPAHRILPDDDPEDAQKLYAYNIRDIEAEHEISQMIPDLIPSELKFWQCDLAINARGIRIDVPMIKAAIEVLEQAHEKYNSRLKLLTEGRVSRASEVAKIQVWLGTFGIDAPVLDAEKVRSLLARTDLPENVREVLEIRDRLSSAAVKKLYAMINQVTQSERLHDLFIYHSARTGRAAGAGVQPQNFPNSGQNVVLCNCGQYSPAVYDTCTVCGSKELKPEEWNPVAVEQTLQSISTKNLDCVEYYHHNAIEALSGCLRGMFIAGEGKDFICSDYSAIEAVVLAALAGEQWRLDVFNTHGKIYEASAAQLTGKTIEEYMMYKKETGNHHPDRKLGKTMELACFTHDTQVLTNRGYVAIVDVLLTDLLWDGVSWVKHSGVIYRGKKSVIDLDGIKITPLHLIFVKNSWKEARELVLNKNILTQALNTGLESLPTYGKIQNDQKEETDSHYACVHAVNLLHRLTIIFDPEGLPDAMFVLKKLRERLKTSGLKITPSMDILYRMLSIDVDSEIACQQLYHVAQTLKIEPIKTTEGEVFPCTKGGWEKSTIFLRTLLQSPGGMMKCLKWIESITIKAMNPETSVLFLNLKTEVIVEKYQICKQESRSLNCVYDIVNAGDNNRFTIKTNSGHLIVHNCGYGGWVGAMKAFGADSFMTEDEIKKAVLAWRAASPAIVEFWGGQVRGWFPECFGLEGAAVQAILNPGQEFDCRGFKWQVRDDVLYCRLLSGRNLTYHRPQLRPSERRNGTYAISFEGWNSNPNYGSPGWVRMDTYAGKLCENVVQAVARDILANAIVNLEQSGYPVVLHVHDEIVSEVPEGLGSVPEFERIMSTMPDWAKDWPLKASGGWRAKRYGK